MNAETNGDEDQTPTVVEISEEAYREFATFASDWLWESDENMVLSYMVGNREAFGSVLCANTKGKHLFQLLRIDQPVFRNFVKSILLRRKIDAFEARIYFTEETSVEIFVEIRAIPKFDEEGKFSGYRGSINDITVRKSLDYQSIFLSNHDELTGLPNRRALNTGLMENVSLADKDGSAFVIAVIDLDGFKTVNDNYGHLAGDNLLIKVAKTIEQKMRREDQVYRTGGDEFVVIMTGIDRSQTIPIAGAITKRVVTAIGQLGQSDSMAVKVGASIGVAAYPFHSKEVAEVTRMADMAMYASKKSGKGQTTVYNPSMDIAAQHLIQMELDLKKAITDDEFEVVYQSKIETNSKTIIGFEAKLRWQHPEKGVIDIEEFEPIAKKLGLLNEIGELSLNKAIGFTSTWQTQDGIKKPIVSVPVSADHFLSEGFMSLTSGLLKEYGLSATRLELEIGSDLLERDVDDVLSKLNRLRDMGVSIAVQHFGCGEASLRFLSQLPVTTLKISDTLIRHLGNNPKAENAAESIVSLGRRFGVSVCAEGVDASNQLSLLEDWHCDFVQGNLFSDLLDGDAVTALLDSLNDSDLDSKNAA